MTKQNWKKKNNTEREELLIRKIWYSFRLFHVSLFSFSSHFFFHGFPFVGCAIRVCIERLCMAGGTPFLTPHTHGHARARELMNCCRIVGPHRIDAKSKTVRCHWQHRQAVDDYDVEEDLPNALKLLGEMNNNVKQVSDLVENMLQRVKSGEITTEYGLSFLEIKYHMLLTYLINLTYVVLRKCSGDFDG